MAEANRRQSYNEKRNIKGRDGGLDKGNKAYMLHILGAAAEMAVASYLGAEEYLFLEEVPVKGSCDIPGIDVKCRSEHHYDLLLFPDEDHAKKIYVLVTISKKKTYMHGFMHGKDAPREWSEKEYAPGRLRFAIKQSSLRPMELLKQIYRPEDYFK